MTNEYTIRSSRELCPKQVDRDLIGEDPARLDLVQVERAKSGFIYTFSHTSANGIYDERMLEELRLRQRFEKSFEPHGDRLFFSGPAFLKEKFRHAGQYFSMLSPFSRGPMWHYNDPALVRRELNKWEHRSRFNLRVYDYRDKWVSGVAVNAAMVPIVKWYSISDLCTFKSFFGPHDPVYKRLKKAGHDVHTGPNLPPQSP